MAGGSKMRDINEILRNEPKVDLQSDPEWFGEDFEKDQEKERKIETTINTMTEIQVANSRIVVLEELWKMERWLNNQLETTLSKVEGERNEIQTQFVKIVEGGSLSNETSENKRKIIKDKRDEGCGASKKASIKRKWKDVGTNEPKEKKTIKLCKTCGKNHLGICLKGKNICYKCKQEGHLATICPNPKKNACFKCGEPGHQAKMCLKKDTEGLVDK